METVKETDPPKDIAIVNETVAHALQVAVLRGHLILNSPIILNKLGTVGIKVTRRGARYFIIASRKDALNGKPFSETEIINALLEHLKPQSGPDSSSRSGWRF